MANDSSKNFSLGCLIPFLIPFFAAGMGTMGYGGYLAWRGHASHAWPTAQGVVMQAGTRTVKDSDGHSTVHADIHYAYEWQGRKFEGDAIRLGGTVTVNNRDVDMLDDLRNYPKGKSVTVHVDPAHPEKAVLVPGVTWMMPTFLSLFGLVFCGMATLFLLIGIKQARKAKAQAAKADVIAFGEEMAGDAPEWLEWGALPGVAASNAQTFQLKEQADGSWKVVPMRSIWIMLGGFAAGGVLMMATSVALFVGFDGAAVHRGVILALVVVGLLFVLVPVWAMRFMRRAASFAPGDRMCRDVLQLESTFKRKRVDVPFSEVLGLQVASQYHAGDNDSAPYTSYQLNLVLKDHARRLVMAHGDKPAMEQDAGVLAQMMKVPVWKLKA